MKLSSFLGQSGEWLRAQGNNIAISSRIRLARNLHSFIFLSQANEQQVAEIEDYIAKKIKSIAELFDYIYLPLQELNDNELAFLCERRLITKEQALRIGCRSVFFKKDESASIMVNEEDHLRIQKICAGFDLENLWQSINALDDILEDNLPYAFHSKFGYLTACPTNVGTGLRVSVMLHLPALQMTNQMLKVHHGLSKFNLILRGFYGEGSEALGDFFQLSNQVTLGKAEQEIILDLLTIVPQILQYEQQVRDSMLKNHQKTLVNSIRDTYFALISGQPLSSEQTMRHLSLLRMGVHTGLIAMDIEQVNELFIHSQPAHLQQQQGQVLGIKERDEVRASYVRKYLRDIYGEKCPI